MTKFLINCSRHMITARQAIDIARQELTTLFDIRGVQVEEYAMDRNRPYWLITLSYTVPFNDEEGYNPMDRDILMAIPQKKWKTVSINRETGEVDAVISGSAWELIK